MKNNITLKDILKTITCDHIIDAVQYVKNNTEEIECYIKKYQETIHIDSRKKKGCFYTQESIIQYILNSVFKDVDISQNPYIRVLDPSCGCGYFLTGVYDILKNMYIEKLHIINRKHPELNLNPENIHEHILEYNLFGADTDDIAVKMAILSLMIKKPESNKIPNIICCDSIINWEDTLLNFRNFWENRFHIIVGNPPYIGHKKLTGQYRTVLNNIYGDIFKDKADISFCFIKSSIDRLCEGGRLCFITSRYFMESPSGKALRNYMRNNCAIESIIDFYGVRIMKGISVDPLIITLTKNSAKTVSKINIIKARMELKNIKEDEVFYKLQDKDKDKYYSQFYVSQHSLKDDGWVLCTHEETAIVNKIEQKLSYKLSDICYSFQGIITGCDKAFIIDDSIMKSYKIERDLVKRWIKNSNIKKYKVDNNTELYIIYTNIIGNIEDYPNAISYIKRQKDKLQNRRECQRGVRKWYELQWGRDVNLFECRKIVFPYKSSCNRFAIDEGSYGSADIYGIIIKPEFFHKTSYECLSAILNSKLYEFYFKSFGKKLGDNLYDYYPNTVMRLMVPLIKDSYLSSRVKTIIETNDNLKIVENMKDIDWYLYDMFKITQEEIGIIEERCAQ